MTQVVYWRRELPPLSEQVEGEHELTATSDRIADDWAARDALWGRCYDSLMAHARTRLTAEVQRQGGSCAHVVDEVIASRHDQATGEFWLHGTFRYLLYRHPEP